MPTASFAKRHYTQTDTGAWAADSPGINVALEKNGLLTEVLMTAEITPSATFRGANQPDGLFRIVQNTTIRGGSGGTYVTLPAEDACMGAILKHYMDRKDFRMGGHVNSIIVAPRRLYNPITFRYHFGVKPYGPSMRENLFDLSSFIPANKETGNLNFIIVTSGNDVMDDTVTISSGTYRFELYVVQGTDADIREEMAAQNCRYPGGAHGMVPAWQGEVYTHTGTFSDYAYSRDVPTGGYLKRICLAFQDAVATRSGRATDEVTAVALEIPGFPNRVFSSFTDAHFNKHDWGSQSQADDAAGDFQNSAPFGLMYLDLRDYMPGLTSDYGPNLGPPVRDGTVKLKFTITTYASGDGTLLLYERNVPLPAAMAASGLGTA